MLGSAFVSFFVTYVGHWVLSVCWVVELCWEMGVIFGNSIAE